MSLREKESEREGGGGGGGGGELRRGYLHVSAPSYTSPLPRLLFFSILLFPFHCNFRASQFCFSPALFLSLSLFLRVNASRRLEGYF